MTSILQLSDTHACSGGVRLGARVDTTEVLDRLVHRIKGDKAAFGPLDAVVVSGDISDDGSAESYSRFRASLAQLDLPLFVIPGNHDLREPMRAAFRADGYLPETGPLNWHRRIGNIHLAGLDTLKEGDVCGQLDPISLSFLRDTLNALNQEPVLLALHHPPFRTGIKIMDEIGLKNAADLSAILSGYGGEIRIVCGHIHCMMTLGFGGHIAISSPPPCNSFVLDTRAAVPSGFIESEHGCLLHRWDGGFQTVRIGLDTGDGPFTF